MEIARVDADELRRDLAGVLERVATGEEIAVVQNEVVVAVIKPPGLTEVMTQGLIKAGILDSDWRERQKRTLTRLRGTRRPSAPEGVLGSATIAAMRDEERF
jgi:prevent-host-death family protein